MNKTKRNAREVAAPPEPDVNITGTFRAMQLARALRDLLATAQEFDAALMCWQEPTERQAVEFLRRQTVSVAYQTSQELLPLLSVAAGR